MSISTWSKISSRTLRNKALGEVVETRVSHKGQKLKATPQDHFINICYEELVSLMGPVDTSIKRGSQPVSTIMLVGLQGSGKTTTAGKLARYLEAQGKKPLLVAADPYRPAAVEQLKVIGGSLNLPVFFKEGPRRRPSFAARPLHSPGTIAVIPRFLTPPAVWPSMIPS